ncbi:hypothetical protein BH09PSE4_BH09PSE4_07490 [soil metagenome]
MRAFPALLILLAAGSCAPAPKPAPPPPRPAPIPTPTPTPAPLSADWRDWPVTPGDWVYRQDARGSIALFGQRGLDADLSLRCDRTTRQVYLSRKGAATTAPFVVRTSSLMRSLPASPVGESAAYLATALSPSDPLLDAMGYSRGHFVLQQEGRPTLVVPAWAEILRVTEDCRG